jgi:hypothetical protein
LVRVQDEALRFFPRKTMKRAPETGLFLCAEPSPDIRSFSGYFDPVRVCG